MCGRIALLESEFYSSSHQSLIIYIEHIKLHAAGAQQAGVRAGPKSYYIYCRHGALKYAIHFNVIWSVLCKLHRKYAKWTQPSLRHSGLKITYNIHNIIV